LTSPLPAINWEERKVVGCRWRGSCGYRERDSDYRLWGSTDEVWRCPWCASAQQDPGWGPVLRPRGGCGYQKPNPDRVAGADLAVASDQLGGARDCRLQVAR